jgi:hypothetical protein
MRSAFSLKLGQPSRRCSRYRAHVQVEGAALHRRKKATLSGRSFQQRPIIGQHGDHNVGIARCLSSAFANRPSLLLQRSATGTSAVMKTQVIPSLQQSPGHGEPHVSKANKCN